MIDYEKFCKIKTLQKLNLSAAQIAKACILDEKTARRYLKIERYTARKSSQRPSMLDPFKDQIGRWLGKYPYSAVQIYERLRQEGYKGGYTMVKNYVRKVRPPKRPAFLTLTFAPGECAQVDWGNAGVLTVGSTQRRLSFFAMVLCYSRMIYVRFTLSQTMEHWLQCHRDAFEFFGGVPQRVMVDNCKTAVLHRVSGQAPVFNEQYAQFATHYGFKISPCNVASGNEKGRVENAVGYIKKNLLAGLERSSLKVIQYAADQWRDQVANVRSHGTTLKQPIELFETERKQLQILPAAPFDCSQRKQPVRSNSQFRISIDGNKYSVPAEYASRRDLSVHLYIDLLRIYIDAMLVAEHQRRYTRGGDYELPDHPKPLLEHRRKARDQALMRRFLTIGQEAEIYYHGLSQRRLNIIHHIRMIVAMLDCYGVSLVRRAMADAAGFHAYSGDCIVNLLKQRERPNATDQSPLHLTRNQDLLNLEQPKVNLDIYSPDEPNNKEN